MEDKEKAAAAETPKRSKRLRQRWPWPWWCLQSACIGHLTRTVRRYAHADTHMGIDTCKRDAYIVGIASMVREPRCTHKDTLTTHQLFISTAIESISVCV